MNVPSLHLCQAMPISCQDFPNYSFVGIENLWSHGLTTIRKKIQIWRQSNGGSRTFQHLLSWKFKGFIMLGYPSQFMPLPLLPHTHFKIANYQTSKRCQFLENVCPPILESFTLLASFPCKNFKKAQMKMMW